MTRYELDEFSDPGPSNESINVNRVLSWRHTKRGGLLIDYQGGWFFDSSICKPSPALQERLERALSRKEGAGCAASQWYQNGRMNEDFDDEWSYHLGNGRTLP